MTGATGFTVEVVEEVKSLPSTWGDGGRGFPSGSTMGADGEIVVVVSSEGFVGGVFRPGGGTKGVASTFKDFPGESLPNEGGAIPGAGIDFIATRSVLLRDGDLRRLLS